ncbi:MAG: thiol:disulfide interchange protein DsbA/DsbL [Betaproteobacteria bacterium]|nr:thiol:disulfide interchange protein DsbA/DsbL [Betaproteobacteria bacterium]
MSLKTSFQRAALAMFAALAMGVALAQAPREITPLNPPQPVENDGKIEVLEFFAYGCIHCANLEPKLEIWAKRQPADVKLKRVPAPFAVRGVDSIPIFYTLEAMGLVEKLHQKIFDAVNVENVNLGAPALLNKWLEKQGVDPKKYEEVQKSFSVDNKIKRARNMAQDYKIAATPTLVVNGRFLLEQAGSSERMFENTDRLIAEARAAMKPAVAAKPAPAAAPAKK